MRRVRTALAGLLVLGGAAGALGAQATLPTAAERAHTHGLVSEARGPGRQLLRGLFRGIALTDGEKTNLQAVHAEYAPQVKALRESLQPRLKELRAARERGDTTALKTIWDKSVVQRAQAKALLEHARDDMRAALLPEHRQQFDENVLHLEQRVARLVVNASQNGWKLPRRAELSGGR